MKRDINECGFFLRGGGRRRGTLNKAGQGVAAASVTSWTKRAAEESQPRKPPKPP